MPEMSFEQRISQLAKVLPGSHNGAFPLLWKADANFVLPQQIAW